MKGLLVFLFSVSAFAMPMKENAKAPSKTKKIQSSVAKKQIKKVTTAKAPAQPVRKGPPVYRVITTLAIDGIKSSGAITVKEGEKGSVANKAEFSAGTFTEVQVNKIKVDGKPVLQLEFVVGEIDAVGNKTIISTPKIIANPGEKSSILMGSAANGKKLVLSAVASQI